jgi:hypothetical protein
MTTQEATMTARRRRRLEQNLQKEARWLQKTIFSLRKARDARSKVVDVDGKPLTPLVSVDGIQIREEFGTWRVPDPLTSRLTLQVGAMSFFGGGLEREALTPQALLSDPRRRCRRHPDAITRSSPEGNRG